MTNTKPEALRLADELESEWIAAYEMQNAAIELRRLHEVNAELLEALKNSIEWVQKAPHGDNCFVSNHYEGDFGNQCHCGKESLENFLLKLITKAKEQA